MRARKRSEGALGPPLPSSRGRNIDDDADDDVDDDDDENEGAGESA